MKKLLLFTLLWLYLTVAYSAPFRFLPHKITQPDGEIIECYVSGDEYYNWIHDKDGYTIIQAPDGYYYYANSDNSKIIPSKYRVNKVNPELLGIKPWVKISKSEYLKRKKRYDLPEDVKATGPNRAPHSGTLNNIVVYIRFSDDAEITTTRQTYDNLMSNTTGYSLKSYFTEISYGNLTINSTHYPACANPTTTNVSYQDSHERNYFRPYNATTNTIGYKTDQESTQREHQLLYDAITWINANSPINADLNIDGDNDGKVDNVCFMIKGNSDGWSDLLWAHRWVLYTKTININGKRVYDYTFQPENQVEAYVLCHEMFHALGAPDLYHYNEETFNPVGPWDLMESGRGHMGAYMKWKYANAKWITTIPEITTSGTYTLNPLASATNNCYKIASPNSDKEFFVVEYRKKEGTFESFIPTSGLLVYRINSDFDGNADFDNISTFDEVYIFRPNGTTSVNGNITTAAFSSGSGRTSINDVSSNPKSFLSNGLPGGLDISNVTSAGNTISFNVYIPNLQKPTNFIVTGTSTNQIDLSWNLNTNNNDVLIAYSSSGLIGAPAKGTGYSVGSSIPGGGTVIYSGNSTSFSHQSLDAGKNYTYRIWSKNSANEYSAGVTAVGATLCGAPTLPIVEGFNSSELSPCWSVATIAIGETQEEPASISVVSSSQYPTATSFEGGYMVKFNSALCGSGNVMRLISPEFSTTGLSQAYVFFNWYRSSEWPSYSDNMIVQWSTDGVSWNSGTTFNRYNSFAGWIQQSYSLPSQALNEPKLRIGFLFTSQYGYNCYLDNVRITTSPTEVEDNHIGYFKIYPNPSNGLFTYSFPEPFSKMLIEVYDITGRRVEMRNYNSSADNTIDLQGLRKGIYLLKIQIDGKNMNRKVIIE